MFLITMHKMKYRKCNIWVKIICLYQPSIEIGSLDHSLHIMEGQQVANPESIASK